MSRTAFCVVTALLASSVSACAPGPRRAARTAPTENAPAKGTPNATNRPGTDAAATRVRATTNASSTTTRPARRKQAYDAHLRTTVASIRAFWRTEMPRTYADEYDDIKGGLYGYRAGSAIPPCDGFAAPYILVQQNAFYCPSNDFIAWDDQGLFPRLEKRYGPFLLSIVLAHEWGHAIQDRVGHFGPGIDAEQQADCFAGAWAASLSTSTRPADATLRAQRDRDLDRDLSGFIEFRDSLGITANTLGAHGTAFDRIRAFQDGYVGGVQSCADYEDEMPDLVGIAFRSFKERFRGGNMPYGQLRSELVPEISRYWSDTFAMPPMTFELSTPLCMTREIGPVGVPINDADPPAETPSKTPSKTRIMTWCADDGKVHYDAKALKALYDSNGDFGVATVIALQWAATQKALVGDEPTDHDTALHAICDVGGWASTLFDAGDPGASKLSPGDLDEAVRVLLEVANREPSLRSGFERIAAFRTGVLSGPKAC